MQALTKPRFFMPIHGEYRHLMANRELAREIGIPENNIFIADIGRVLELTQSSASWGEPVPAGKVLVDGYGVGDVGSIVLRDRRHLAQDGLIVVVAGVDEDAGLIITGPDIISRGFVYVREAEELMEEARQVAIEALNACLNARKGFDRMQAKTRLRDDLTKFLYAQTKRKPMILPVIMDV